MLSADYLDIAPDAIIALFQEYEQSVINDIARRLAGMDIASPTAAWQMQRLTESGLVYDAALAELSKLTGRTEAELNKLFRDAGVRALAFDDAIYQAAGLNPLPLNLSPAMTQVLVAGLQRTQGTMRNLTLTSAIDAQNLFTDAADLAYMQVSSGAFDYNTAIRQAVESVAEQGLGVIHYASGRREHLDVAMRRAVLTGVNQTAGQLQWARADEMGCDLVETSAHIGARNTGTGPANHEGWQGRVFSRSGQHPKYPDFIAETGFGTGPGLCGWGCRHSYYPFYEGISERVYSDAQVNEYARKTVNYNGQDISVYEATQKQRAIEREIRKAKREAGALEAAGLDNTEARGRVSELQKKMRDFIRQTELNRDYVREQATYAPKLKNLSQTGMKIDFTSTNPQHIADLCDVQRHFQANDPGYQFITQRPVLYNQYSAGHLTDSEHVDRLAWLETNQEGLLSAIMNPDFIERATRERSDGHFSITLIKELYPGDKDEGRFMSVAISLSQNLEIGYHQITTIHPSRWRNLFYMNGEVKHKYLKIK